MCYHSFHRGSNMADAVTFKATMHDQLRRLSQQRLAIKQAFGQLNPKEKRIVVIAVIVVLLAVGFVISWQTHGGQKSSFVGAFLNGGNVPASIIAAGPIEPWEVVAVVRKSPGRSV